MFTEKAIQGKPDYKARLVVPGCQEDGLHQDRCAHWIARRLLHDALSSSSKRLGLQRVRCSVSVPSVRRRRETLAVADASQKSKSWNEARASVCCYWFVLRDERCWTCVVRAQKESARGSWFCGVKLYYLHGPSGLEVVVHTHVDDFLSAFKKASKKYKDALQHLVRELLLKQQSGLVVYCGRTISRDGNQTKVTQTTLTMSFECLNIDLAGRTL